MANLIPERKPFHFGYHSGLDGIRGISILTVLVVHGLSEVEIAFGFVAVNTFFVLSGFLITCLLVEEWDRSGDFSLRHFYLRRALRLLPALCAMLVAFLIFAFAVDPHKRAVRELFEALRALFYFTNWARIFHIGRTVSLVHTWSLSVEEQFYLLWPLALLWGLRKNTRASLLCWILLGVVLSLLARIGWYVAGTENLSGTVVPLNSDRLVYGLDTRADALLLGCFAGVIIASNLLPSHEWFRRILNWSAALAVIGLIAISCFWVMAPWMIYWGWLLASICAVILIAHIVIGSRGSVRWVLENRALVFVGRISYGLYVWHFPIMLALRDHGLPWKNMFYLVWVFPVAIISYYFIEKPCLNLKSRFGSSPILDAESSLAKIRRKG